MKTKAIKFNELHNYECKIDARIEEIERNVFAVSNSLNNYATQLFYDFNQKIEAELLQRISVGALTRLKHQIESELLRRGTK